MPIKRKVQDTSFKGVDLTPNHVYLAFTRCMINDKTPDNDKVCSILYPEYAGFKEDSELIVFSEKALNKNKQYIAFLLGQLKCIHDGKQELAMEDLGIRYDGKVWTDSERNETSSCSSCKRIKIYISIHSRWYESRNTK